MLINLCQYVDEYYNVVTVFGYGNSMEGGWR